MKWLDQWFFRKWQWAWENRDSVEPAPQLSTAIHKLSGRAIIEEDSSWEDGLRITIKKMIGGSVVSFRIYDRRTDRSDTRNYIITDEQDFNTELGKIITMESMRQT